MLKCEYQDLGDLFWNTWIVFILVTTCPQLLQIFGYNTHGHLREGMVRHSVSV